MHIAVDLARAEALAEEWRRLGLGRLPLELVDCPDRRLTRSVLEVVAEALADGQTEVSVLVPRRAYRRAWHRLLHDRTSEAIAHGVANLVHANVTYVPYHLGAVPTRRPSMSLLTHGVAGAQRSPFEWAGPGLTAPGGRSRRRRTAAHPSPRPGRTTVRVVRRVRSVRVQPWGDVPALACTLVDATGGLSVVFLGRRKVGGVRPGARMVVEGVVGEHGGKLALLNPDYSLLDP